MQRFGRHSPGNSANKLSKPAPAYGNSTFNSNQTAGFGQNSNLTFHQQSQQSMGQKSPIIGGKVEVQTHGHGITPMMSDSSSMPQRDNRNRSRSPISQKYNLGVSSQGNSQNLAYRTNRSPRRSSNNRDSSFGSPMVFSKNNQSNVVASGQKSGTKLSIAPRQGQAQNQQQQQKQPMAQNPIFTDPNESLPVSMFAFKPLNTQDGNSNIQQQQTTANNLASQIDPKTNIRNSHTFVNPLEDTQMTNQNGLQSITYNNTNYSTTSTIRTNNFSQVGGESTTLMNSQYNIPEMVEKYKATKTQNKELKSMLIEKENEMNGIRRDNQKLREEIKSMLDPMGGKAVLREVKYSKFWKIRLIFLEIQEKFEGKRRQNQRTRI